MALKVPSDEGHMPVYVRSISGRPNARMDLSAAQCRLEGQKAEVSSWSMGPYIVRYKVILSRNQLLGHT